jgi:Patatin-like phospholipase
LTLAGSAFAAPHRALAFDEVKVLDVVFEGGGIKGAAFCGALEVLESRGFSYRNLIGTSAGAITAALLASGYRSGQMQAILTERDGNGRHVFNRFLLPPSSDTSGDAGAAKTGSFFDRAKAKASDPRHMTDEGVLGQPSRPLPTKILGLLLGETLSLAGVDPVDEKKHLAEKLPVYRSLSRVLNAMSGASDQEAIHDSRRPEVAALGLGADGPLCRIPVKGYQTLDFDMDEGRMKTLIKSGRTTMENYLPRPA